MSNTKMVPESNTDIIVIGGGPAGTAVAKRLAELGHDIVLLEKAVFPRPHVGICLSNATEALLDYLDVSHAVESAGFFRRKATLVKWGTDLPLPAEQSGMHVDRGVFDHILLEKARSSGVTCIQPARVLSARRCPGGGWQVAVENADRTSTMHARFLVDASGRANVVTGKRVRYAPPLLAVHATWLLRNRPSHDGFMEAGKDAWLWIACLPQQQALISIYMSPQHLERRGSRSIGSYYESMLGEFSLMQYCERDVILGDVKACDASSRHAAQPIGDDFIRVGDANLSVDPMASQGVHMALSSGIQAAVVINTILRYPEHSDAALRFYRERQQERIKQFRHRTASEYARIAGIFNERFWQERAEGVDSSSPAPTGNLPQLTTSQQIQLCPKGRFLPTPVMTSDRISLEPALYHPKLDRPVAFLGGTSLYPLLRSLSGKQTVNALLASWESQISNKAGMQIIVWLWKHQLLVSESSCSVPLQRETSLASTLGIPGSGT